MGAQLDLDLPAGPRAPSAAREALDGLEDHLDPRLLENVRLLVSELVTNSLRHAGIRRRDAIRLRVLVTTEFVRAEVCDSGPGFDARIPVPTVGQVGGWGLFLVEQIADRWGVETSDDNCVWFEISRHLQSARSS